MNNIIYQPNKCNLSVAFDVGKDSLDWYTELPVKNSNNTAATPMRGRCKNAPFDIHKQFDELISLARKNGYKSIHSLSEPTGIYDRNLLREAKQSQCTSSQISGVATHKYKQIASRTLNKSDNHDPVVIYRLAKVTPGIKPRDFSFEYQELKEYSRSFLETKKKVAILKGQIQELIFRIFPEYPCSKDLLFTSTGATLINKFGGNPLKITKASKEKFIMRFKKHSPKCMFKTLESLYESAYRSKGFVDDKRILDLFEERLCFYYQEFEFYTGRKVRLKNKLETCYDELNSGIEFVPNSTKPFSPKLRLHKSSVKLGQCMSSKIVKNL